MTGGGIIRARRLRRAGAALLALAAVAPAFAAAQAQGATGSGSSGGVEVETLPPPQLPGAVRPGEGLGTARPPVGSGPGVRRLGTQGTDMQGSSGPGLGGGDSASRGFDAQGQPTGRGAGAFRGVPLGPDGKPLEYAAPAPPQPEMKDARIARLGFLDKMTGQVRKIEIEPGQTIVEDRLELALMTCRVPVEEARGGAYAYLRIRDTREQDPRFSGWMFSTSPALSALDHARYDVWVESCSASSGEQSGDKE